MTYRFTLTPAEFAALAPRGGYCVRCGRLHELAQPDVAGGICGACGAPEVYGAERLLEQGRIQLDADAGEVSDE